MTFQIQRNIFDNVISLLQPFIEKKDNSSITSHIYIEVIDSALILRATDYEIGIETTIYEISNHFLGKTTVNGVNLLNIIKRLKNDFITLNLDEVTNQLTIQQNSSEFKLQTFEPTEFPIFPALQNSHAIETDTIALINSFKKISQAVAINNPKHEINGALLEITNNKINFVGTDTKRLSYTYIDTNYQPNEATTLIIPKKSIIEVQKIFFDNIDINYDNTNLIITNKNIKFFTKLINGKYPEYKRVIPTEFKETIEINKDLFIDSIKLITFSSYDIKINFTKDKISFESLDTNTESHTDIDVNLNISEDFYIQANGKHILDALFVSDNSFIKLQFNDSKIPFCIKDDKFITVLMPINN